jgi:hypothetical protein
MMLLLNKLKLLQKISIKVDVEDKDKELLKITRTSMYSKLYRY